MANDIDGEGNLVFSDSATGQVAAKLTEGKDRSYIPCGEANAALLFEGGIDLPALSAIDFEATIHRWYVDYYESWHKVSSAESGAGVFNLVYAEDRLMAQFQFTVDANQGKRASIKLGLKKVGEGIYDWVDSVCFFAEPLGSDMDFAKPVPAEWYNIGAFMEDRAETNTTTKLALMDLKISHIGQSNYKLMGDLNIQDENGVLEIGECVAIELSGSLGLGGSRGLRLMDYPYPYADAGQSRPGTFTYSGKETLTFDKNVRCPSNRTQNKSVAEVGGRFRVMPGSEVCFMAGAYDVVEAMGGRIDIYGTAVQGGYSGMPDSVNVYEGGLLIGRITKDYSGFGWDGVHQITIMKGGTMRVENWESLGPAYSNPMPIVLDGGIVTSVYDGPDWRRNMFINMKLLNGARLTGTRIDAGASFIYNEGPTITCTRLSPSFIETDGLWCFHEEDMTSKASYQTVAPPNFAKFVVDDVTGDDASDLIVTAPVLDKAKNQKAVVTDSGLWKKNAGTLELSGGAEFNGVLKMEAGTVCFRTKGGAFGGLLVVGDSALDIADGAQVAFGDSSSVAWMEGKTLTLATRLERKSLRFGTDANGLTVEQLAAIRYADGVTTKTPVFALDENGYLTDGLGGGFFLRVR